MDDKQRLELKIQALKEGFRNKVAQITDEYEDRIADLRIELTEFGQSRQELITQVQGLQQRVAELEGEQVEVVQEDPAVEAASD